VSNIRQIERALGLPWRYLEDEKNLKLPETQILLNIIESMPFILEVAEGKFEPKLTNEILQREAEKIRVNMRMRDVVS
jgi:hypothetical protein